ncbi:MAG TPA: hypothetical protein VJM75_01825, partial [Acidimicrobiales bacterium]|nr:hypothetical protein [Acidimicrobiales bacterium]
DAIGMVLGLRRRSPEAGSLEVEEWTGGDGPCQGLDDLARAGRIHVDHHRGHAAESTLERHTSDRFRGRHPADGRQTEDKVGRA